MLKFLNKFLFALSVMTFVAWLSFHVISFYDYFDYVFMQRILLRGAFIIFFMFIFATTIASINAGIFKKYRSVLFTPLKFADHVSDSATYFVSFLSWCFKKSPKLLSFLVLFTFLIYMPINFLSLATSLGTKSPHIVNGEYYISEEKISYEEYNHYEMVGVRIMSGHLLTFSVFSMWLLYPCKKENCENILL